MPASRPKRKRLIIIIIILGNLILTIFNSDLDDVLKETLLARLCRAMPLMKIDENNWTVDDHDVYDQIETIATMFDNSTVPSESAISKASDDLETALTAAGL